MEPNGHNFRRYELYNNGFPSHNQHMHHLMNQQEIPVPNHDPLDDYPSPNNQQMQQLYHENGQYGSRGYQSHNYSYAPTRIPFEVSQRQYSSEPMSVDICFSSSRYINRDLLHKLYRQAGLTGKVRGGFMITVTGYPVRTRGGASEFLTAVKDISGDRMAYIVD